MSSKTIAVYPDKTEEAVWQPRRRTHAVKISNGPVTVTVGGLAPVVVQSMTNTATEDVAATVAQVRELADAGSELVRLTVNTPQAAQAVPLIRKELDDAGYYVPLVGDFHFNGHKLLTDYPGCAAALSKYRINPGNVGKGARHDDNFATMVRIAADNGKAVRIGVNGGSLDKELLTQLMEENRRREKPRTVREVTLEAIVQSAHQGKRRAGPCGSLPQPLVPGALGAASGPDRSRRRHQGRRGQRLSSFGASFRRDRRHGPHFDYARAGPLALRRGLCGAGAAAEHGAAAFFAPRGLVPGVRPHVKRPFPEACGADAGISA